MLRRPPITTRTDTLFPYTTLFRSLYSGSIMVNGALALPNPVTVLLYRIYIPASGLPLNADVPLPALTLETAAGDVLVPSRAGCSEPVLGTVVNQLEIGRAHV